MTAPDIEMEQVPPGYVPVAPAPAAEPVVQDRTTTRGTRTVRRNPTPRGTVAIGAAGAVAIAGMTAAVALPPVVVVAAGAALAVIPLSVLRRRGRRGRSGFGRAGGGGRRNPLAGLFGGRGRGGGGGGNPLAGLGRLGGRPGTSPRTAAGAGRFSPGRHRGGSNPLSGLKSTRAGATGGGAGRRAPTTAGGTRRAGTTAGGAGTTAGRAARRAGRGAWKATKVGGRGAAALGRAAGRATGPVGRAAWRMARPVGRGAWKATKVGGRGAAALGRGAGRGAGMVARAARAGFRGGGTARAAAKRAWGYAGRGRTASVRRRVVGWVVGASGAVIALIGRVTVNGVRRLRAWCFPPQNAVVTPPAQPRVPRQPSMPATHPVSIPLSLRPQPAPQPLPLPVRQPVATSPGPTPGGASSMSGFFPLDVAIDFHGACSKWSPGSGDKCLINLRAALPLMAETQFAITNGWGAMIKNIARDLAGGMNPSFVHALNEVYGLQVKSSQVVNGLVSEFSRMHENYESRLATKGGHTANV